MPAYDLSSGLTLDVALAPAPAAPMAAASEVAKATVVTWSAEPVSIVMPPLVEVTLALST